MLDFLNLYLAILYFFFRLYGLWFVGFKEIFSSDAFEYTAASVLLSS